MTEIVVIDNHDSFTYNLVDYLAEHADVHVVTNEATIAELAELDPDGFVVSPGPGHPANERDVGVSVEVFKTIGQRIPTFGVCLGLEAAVFAYGGTVDRATTPRHGESSVIDHDGRGVFDGLPDRFRAGRYHSLIPTEVPACFETTARTDNDERLVMGIRHRRYPIECVMFHPESVLTPVGRELMANVIEQVKAGQPVEVTDG